MQCNLHGNFIGTDLLAAIQNVPRRSLGAVMTGQPTVGGGGARGCRSHGEAPRATARRSPGWLAGPMHGCCLTRPPGCRYPGAACPGHPGRRSPAAAFGLPSLPVAPLALPAPPDSRANSHHADRPPGRPPNHASYPVRKQPADVPRGVQVIRCQHAWGRVVQQFGHRRDQAGSSSKVFSNFICAGTHCGGACAIRSDTKIAVKKALRIYLNSTSRSRRWGKVFD
jgi:hypothetical protein